MQICDTLLHDTSTPAPGTPSADSTGRIAYANYARSCGGRIAFAKTGPTCVRLLPGNPLSHRPERAQVSRHHARTHWSTSLFGSGVGMAVSLSGLPRTDIDALDKKS